MTRLIDTAGNVRFGIFPEPIAEVNFRDFALTDPFGSKVGRLRSPGPPTWRSSAMQMPSASSCSI